MAKYVQNEHNMVATFNARPSDLMVEKTDQIIQTIHSINLKSYSLVLFLGKCTGRIT